MRRIAWIACATLAACSGGNLFGSSSATDVALAMELANAGVRQCVQHQPPPMAACAGKQAGDACQVADDDDDDDMEARLCKALRDGRLVCVEVDDHDDEAMDEDDDDRPPAPLKACDGKNAGDACALSIADQSKEGVCRAFERDGHEVLACVPPPAQPATAPRIVACNGKAAGDACTVQREEKAFTGVCHGLPSGVLLCLPPPPNPPQAALDACAAHQANDACSFSFKEHQFQGACVLEPDGKTLVCAPVCKAHRGG
jgi:hypothetical protein